MEYQKPIIYAIVGNSGIGKTTIARRLFDANHTLVSDTSRPPREGEVDGLDYIFKTQNEMLSSSDDDYLEFISFNGNYYGYSFAEIKKKIAIYGTKVVAVITADGLQSFLESEYLRNHVEIQPIFMFSSEEKIKKNLQTRNDSEENINKRLKMFNYEKEENLNLYTKIASFSKVLVVEDDDTIDDIIQKFIQLM